MYFLRFHKTHTCRKKVTIHRYLCSLKQNFQFCNLLLHLALRVEMREGGRMLSDQTRLLAASSQSAVPATKFKLSFIHNNFKILLLIFLLKIRKYLVWSCLYPWWWFNKVLLMYDLLISSDLSVTKLLYYIVTANADIYMNIHE